jgi:uncharacterized membrane protein
MASDHLTPARMEAFSDGVIAVIITIMVLDLRVPTLAATPNNSLALHADLKLVLIYLLSFVQTGIYWVNHHYLTDDIKHVTHGILWANLALLFSLSLIPFATNWIGERGITPFSVALYSFCCALPALAWSVLAIQIHHRSGKPLTGSPTRQIVSSCLYLGAIFVAYLSPVLAIAMVCAVTILWLLPPRRVIENTGEFDDSPRQT